MRRCWWAGLFLAAGLLLAGCGRQAAVRPPAQDAPPPPPVTARPLVLEKPGEAVLVYCLTGDRRYLVPVTVAVRATAELPAVAVQKVLAGPPLPSLRAAVPAGIKLQSLTREGDAAILVLAGQVKGLTGTEATLAAQALAYTLFQFPGVGRVRIRAGEALPEKELLPAGEELNPLYAGRPKAWARTYFGSPEGLLVPVTLAVEPAEQPLERVRRALLRQVEGPPAGSGLYPTVWPGTRLVGLSLEETTGILTVDLSGEAVGYGGGALAEQVFVDSLVLTATEFPQVRLVRLRVAGRKGDLPEGTDISRPLPRPARLNYLPAS